MLNVPRLYVKRSKAGSLFRFVKMADTEHNNHVDKNRKSCLISSASSLSTNKICTNIDEKFQLIWPPVDERDLTQIQIKDPTPQSYSKETANHYPKVALCSV